MQRASWFHQRIDEPVTFAVTRLWHRSNTVDAAFIIFAKWTPIVMLISIAAAAAGIGLNDTAHVTAYISSAAAIITAVFARLVNEPISRGIERARPFEQFHFLPLLTHSKGGGFPSNHATGAFALAICMTPVPGYGPSLLVLALLLLIARVYNGLHYLSDVIAGALHGTFWAMVMSLLAERIFYSH